MASVLFCWSYRTTKKLVIALKLRQALVLLWLTRLCCASGKKLGTATFVLA